MAERKVDCLMVDPGPVIESEDLPYNFGALKDHELGLAYLAARHYYTFFKESLLSKELMVWRRFMIFARSKDEPLRLDVGPSEKEGESFADPEKVAAKTRYDMEDRELRAAAAEPHQSDKKDKLFRALIIALLAGVTLAAIKAGIRMAQGAEPFK